MIPFAEELWLDAEDSLGVVGDAPVGRPAPPTGDEWLRVAAIRLPRISNSTDVEALACEPGVSVHWVSEPSRLADADLVVLPGSKSTVTDLEWLRRSGIGDALIRRARAGGAVLGICGGYQMLGTVIDDDVESGAGSVDGLGLLDLEIAFAPDKVLAQVQGDADGIPLRGYEIHHGRVRRNGDAPLLSYADGGKEGSVRAVCAAPTGTGSSRTTSTGDGCSPRWRKRPDGRVSPWHRTPTSRRSGGAAGSARGPRRTASRCRRRPRDGRQRGRDAVADDRLARHLTGTPRTERPPRLGFVADDCHPPEETTCVLLWGDLRRSD
ncbi:hypothetical protein GS584_15830 [Rhodococcus hoagii]|nr:hypothetical protein [Prescottella equi]